jgi:hypothetical protein
MRSHVHEELPPGCPICQSDGAGVLEIDRPTVWLCDCDRCGKFIVSKMTCLRLAGKSDFSELRQDISNRIKKHFDEFKRPLQIISYNEKPLVQDSVTIGKLIFLCRGEPVREKSAGQIRPSQSNHRFHEAPPLFLTQDRDNVMRSIQNSLKTLFSALRFGSTQ